MSDSEHDWLRPEEEHETETIIDAGTAQNNPEVADAVAKIAALRPVDRQCRHGHRLPAGGTLQIHVPSGRAEGTCGLRAGRLQA